MYQLPVVPPSYTAPNGRREWYDANGNTHNVNGPAIMWENGDTEWIVYVEGRGEVVVCCAKEFQELTGCSDEHIRQLEAKYGDIY